MSDYKADPLYPANNPLKEYESYGAFMSELPKWPEPFDQTQQTLASYLGNVAELEYERARYLAAMARLRVAVAILKRYDCAETDDITAAIRAIGELPPATHNQS